MLFYQQISGKPPASMDIAFTPLNVGVRSTAFFDKLVSEGEIFLTSSYDPRSC
jgi:hypothetical protein